MNGPYDDSRRESTSAINRMLNASERLFLEGTHKTRELTERELSYEGIMKNLTRFSNACLLSIGVMTLPLVAYHLNKSAKECVYGSIDQERKVIPRENLDSKINYE